ncbi:SusC/RagA family TonB-linked outer membrane protein [Robertkochia solimangrovi]|uniref:SusC/RagA family TonB-linked outer membrane protein n=1 Tax=Robertkochia solimangrovi TaxID=2213046 RepID=UPI00117FDDE9|nr:SusC/RagA family TonB-linked outer membrane protein [Robertkochia solimangrovi]TRZ41292.1 SusC/RagA family TonB-linked outer membrane protein [Robertkochia solimangrovi]
MKKKLSTTCCGVSANYADKLLELMRKSLILFILFTNIAVFAFSQKVTIKVKNQPISEILRSISQKTGVDFFYSDMLFNAGKQATLNVKDIDILTLTNELIGIHYRAKFAGAKMIVIVPAEDQNVYSAFGENQQELIVNGRITDSYNVPLIGVTVWRKGTRKGTATDENGNYRIQAAIGDTLVYNYLGYKQQFFEVTKDPVIDVTMEEDISELNAVTVVSTGYQKISRERATGSFSVISSEELEKVPTNNVINRLEGQVAGLQVELYDSDNTFVYGNLMGETEGNTSYNFRIRGQSTYQAEDMPLIVVDGVPTELDIRTLNPDDIENITFLKDAASASIYGARAANGVIVIDTKKGQAGKVRINFSQNYTFSNKPSLSSLPLMNSSQVLDMESELIEKGFVTDPAMATSLYSSYPISQGMETMFQYRRGNISQAEMNAQLELLRGRNNYDQITKYLIQPASSANYNLSISGGQDDYTYFTSASYSEEKTQAKGTEGKRLTLTLNQNFKLFNFVDFNTSLKGSFFDYKQNGLGLSPIAASLTSYLPYDQMVDENGNSVNYYRNFYSEDIREFENAGYLPWQYNYIDELNNSDNTNKNQNYSANIQMTVPLFKGLDAIGTYYIERAYVYNDLMYNENTYFTRNSINMATYLDPVTGTITRNIPEGGIYSKNRYITSSYTARGQLRYSRNFNEKHNVDAIGGIEVRQTREINESGKLYGYNPVTQTSIDLPSTTYMNIYGYNTNTSYGNSYKNQRKRFLSYYGNASYSYLNKYVLSGSIRLDDYNNFGLDKKYRRTPLWSTGFKWNITRESFMENVNFLNNLSFRTSFGYNGNISLTTYPFTNISLVDSDYFTGDPYASISAAANPALRWEKTGVLNFGLDFSMFNSRLNGTVEYYRKNSEDLLQDFPVSQFYGLPNNTLTRNTSTLEGRGVDLTLNGIVLKSNDFSLNTGLVLSYNKNEVTDTRYESYSNYLNGTGSTPPIIGYGLNSIFAFRSAGLDENGNMQVYNKDGDIVDNYTLLTDIEDMEYMGTRTPKYYGSLNTTINYKKWSLYALATFKFDYVLFKPAYSNYISRYGTFNQYDLSAEIDDRWRVAGDEANTNVPAMSGMYGYGYSRYIFSNDRIIDGDHIRLREISLSYDLTEYMKNTFINNASLTFAARNLGLIWAKNDEGIDPDFLPYTAGNLIKLPPTAMYSIGINVNF